MNFKILYHIGRYVIMLGTAFSRPERFNMYYKETTRQMDSIGVGSLTIVALIAVFIGAVTAVQFAYQLDGTLVPIYYIGYIVRDSMIIELAPTITCLVLAGKVGSNIAAEIGGMRQKEHIDAMEIMGVNTANYLITPKIIAALVVIPLLVSIAAFVGVFGGYLSVVLPGYMTATEYEQGVRSFFDSYNFFLMYIKAFVFAFILTSVA
ncbi:MAG: ABC transporter permease, partial [Bacteroidota bacterium]